MNTFDTIMARRSIRKFTAEPVSREQVERILQAGIAAPSAKNRQPWSFVVVHSEEARTAMCDTFQRGIDIWKDESPEEARWVEYTLSAMRQASVTIAIQATGTAHPNEDGSASATITDICDLQSLGAAVQNMILAAWEMGLGSLWICDTFAAYPQLVEYFGFDHLMMAVVSFGIADEDPAARPRRSMQDVAIWR